MVKKRVRFAIWWRKAGMGLRAAVFVLAAVALIALIYWIKPDEESVRSTGGIAVFVLVNLNIAIICVLAFLIGRNIVKLVFDRRRGILGSKLRSRLVAAFVGLTLIPTIILFVLASGLLNRAMQGWFSSQIETSVEGAVGVARQHYLWLKEFSKRLGLVVAGEIKSHPDYARNSAALRTYLESQRRGWNLFSLSLLRGDGTTVMSVQNAAAGIEDFSEPPPDKEALAQALNSESGVLFEEKEASQFVRAYVPVSFDGKRAVLITTVRIAPELAQNLTTVNNSFREYQQLKLLRQPIKSGYILTLSMITGLLLFSAIWIAFYIARELAVPIQRLAEATQSIAKGRYDVQIREKGGDEMGLLVKSFNQMTSEIRRSRGELDRRRVYIETVLSNLAVGVVGLDTEHRVTSVNAAAARIFAILDVTTALGRGIEEVLHGVDFEELRPLLEEVEEQSKMNSGEEIHTITERLVAVASEGRKLKVLSTVGQIRDERGKVVGYVLLFDDITELAKAEQMAAWREVAQRIAHEIKNPLTPIQLSAQRLDKLTVRGGDESAAEQAKIHDCVQTILEHVVSIKRLADEFSRFARMPQAEFKLVDMNALISDLIGPYAESNADIAFQFIADSLLPKIEVDREQVRRVFINLIENAVAALRSDNVPPESRSAGLRVTVTSRVDAAHKQVVFEVLDNGAGVSKQERSYVFEPYFTTKKGGTGLGLAIVSSIMADHRGSISLHDNHPRGARFVLQLPISQTRSTQRRFEKPASLA